MSKVFLSGNKAIAFDLYGTLIYISNPRKPYNKLFADLKLNDEASKNIRKLLLTQEFNSVKEFVKHIAPNYEGDLTSAEENIQAESSSATLYPETLHVLEKLSQRYDLYLISNLSTPFKKPVHDLGIDKYFKEIFYSCERGCMKPQSRFYKMLIEASGLRAKEILMVGDSLESDYKGARNCGMDAVLLDRNRKQPHGISSLSELLTER